MGKPGESLAVLKQHSQDLGLDFTILPGREAQAQEPLPARLGEPDGADVKPPADEAGDAALAVGRLLYRGDISLRGIHSAGNDSLSEGGWRVCVEMGVITLHVRQSVLPR